MIFRDHGRTKTEYNPLQHEQNRDLIEAGTVDTMTSANNLSANSNWKAANNSQANMSGGIASANSESQAIGESRDHNTMGTIEEEDSVDFSQSIRSQQAKENQNTYTQSSLYSQHQSTGNSKNPSVHLEQLHGPVDHQSLEGHQQNRFATHHDLHPFHGTRNAVNEQFAKTQEQLASDHGQFDFPKGSGAAAGRSSGMSQKYEDRQVMEMTLKSIP